MTNLILSIMVFASMILFFGAWRMRSDTENRLKMILMIITALVIIGNIWIWTLPTDNGKTLADDNIERIG